MCEEAKEYEDKANRVMDEIDVMLKKLDTIDNVAEYDRMETEIKKKMSLADEYLLLSRCYLEVDDFLLNGAGGEEPKNRK